MATITPFRALRYQLPAAANAAAVLAPPYDVINADLQQALYARDPHNVIRLEYGTQSTTDSAVDNRYTRARTTLDDWLADGTLAFDASPCYYPHVQRFAWAGETRVRRGFFATVRLQPFDDGDVLPHEWTLKGPKEDRLQLMRTCLACFSPIFGLYDGRHTDIGACLNEATAGTPTLSATGDGFDETLWQSADPARNAAITAAMQQRQILIADGHHRYETMLAMRDLLRQEFPDAPDTAPFNTC